MRIGIPKEIKNHEYRVGMTPAGVAAFIAEGHEVFVESNAGTKAGFDNEAYKTAGAKIVDSASYAYDSDMVIKVKEPQPAEYSLMHDNQLLFTYLHLAPAPELTQALLDAKVTGVAYETITDDKNRLPLLIPMSEIAGRLSIQAGATALQMANQGRGVLLGGVPGTPPAKVVVIGGGVVGTQAAKMAMGLGADVTILDVNLDRLRYLDDVYGPLLKTRFADGYALQELATDVDLLVGAVLIPGKQAPKLVSREMIASMRPGSVFVDVAIDQGGCAETSYSTTHQEPTYIVDDVVHYCVANMPGAVARTSTLALTNATLPYAVQLANKGIEALKDNAHLANGLNVYQGKVTYKAVADDLGYEYVPFERLSM